MIYLSFLHQPYDILVNTYGFTSPLPREIQPLPLSVGPHTSRLCRLTHVLGVASISPVESSCSATSRSTSSRTVIQEALPYFNADHIVESSESHERAQSSPYSPLHTLVRVINGYRLPQSNLAEAPALSSHPLLSLRCCSC